MITSSTLTFSLQTSQKKIKRNGAEYLLEEVIAKHFLNLERETNIQVQEAQKAPNKMNPRMSTPRLIINCKN